MARPLLLLTWRDHYSTMGWRNPEDFAKLEPDLNRSVGWLLAENDERLTIAQTIGSEEIRDTLTLEKSCLVKRRVLR